MQQLSRRARRPRRAAHRSATPLASSPDQILRVIPLRDLDRLIMVEGVSITSHALAALLRSAIPVNLLGWNGRYLGGFHPATNAHGLARLRQYRRTLDPEFALSIARKILHAKLYNQRRVLQRLLASRTAVAAGAGAAETTTDTAPPPDTGPGVATDNPAVKAAVTWLDGFFASIDKAATLDELRGRFSLTAPGPLIEIAP